MMLSSFYNEKVALFPVNMEYGYCWTHFISRKEAMTYLILFSIAESRAAFEELHFSWGEVYFSKAGVWI